MTEGSQRNVNLLLGQRLVVIMIVPRTIILFIRAGIIMASSLSNAKHGDPASATSRFLVVFYVARPHVLSAADGRSVFYS